MRAVLFGGVKHYHTEEVKAMKTWLKISCLTLALALAGCAASQPSLGNVKTPEEQLWVNPLTPQEPSAEPTNWGILMDLQGGG